MIELPTVDQAEDAAANAMARLLVETTGRYFEHMPDEQIADAIRLACRDLLRGPVDEDHSRQLGGYCMKAPTDPTLRALGVLGNRLVELSYTTRDPQKAMAEAASLWVALHREVEDR